MASILAAIDNAKRQAARRAQDLYNDPRGFLQQLADTLANSNAGTAPVISRGELTNRPKTKEERQQEAFDMATNSINGGLGVIKPRGGQWLSGSIEATLNKLKKGAADIGIDPADHAPTAAVNNWIEGPLTKYVRNDMATVGDPVRALAEQWPTKKAALLQVAQAKLDKLNAKTRELMATRGVPEEYLTRHRQDVLAAERAVRQVEMREPLHTGLRQSPRAAAMAEDGLRTPTGVSDAAKLWDGMADSSILDLPASKYQEGVGPGWAANLWLDKTPGDTRVYSPYAVRGEAGGALPTRLGLDHMIDEASNAVSPSSGLPAELLLDPAKLYKMTVAQMSEHVSKINAWRAAQEVELNTARANNAATHLHKEYPDDPRGLRWVELRQGETPNTGMATRQLARDKALQELKDALKYEGDTMGHCVGGYCDDVASGKSKIYSLRDKNGQPHVTIEVSPGLGRESAEHAENLYSAEVRAGRVDPHETNFADWLEANDMPVTADTKVKDSIVQIKGKYNDKPDDDLLPFVQDFVKSGQWSDVGDLRNANLQRVQDIDGAVRYVLPEEYQALKGSKGFASGGLVQQKNITTAQELSAIINQLRNGMPNNA